MDLDNPAAYGAVDVADALADVEASGQQWADGVAAAADTPVFDLERVDAVVVTGMGGSGIVGDVVAATASDRLRVPVVVHKTYRLPAFVGPRTAVVVVSYSGDTEETCAALEVALDAGAQVLAVTSGGRVAARCREVPAPLVTVPRGLQPRHALGYLAAPALHALGLDDGVGEAASVLRELAARHGRAVPTVENPAKQLALRVAASRLVVSWGATGAAAVAAYRLKCQLNENAKLPAMASIVPELHHNEIAGWQEPSVLLGGAGVITFRDVVAEHERLTRRITAAAALLDDRVAWGAELVATGESLVARLASLLLQADLVSVYAALALDRDPTPIAFIDHLKAGLAVT